MSINDDVLSIAFDDTFAYFQAEWIHYQDPPTLNPESTILFPDLLTRAPREQAPLDLRELPLSLREHPRSLESPPLPTPAVSPESSSATCEIKSLS